jgi:hypothetical protein
VYSQNQFATNNVRIELARRITTLTSAEILKRALKQARDGDPTFMTDIEFDEAIDKRSFVETFRGLAAALGEALNQDENNQMKDSLNEIVNTYIKDPAKGNQFAKAVWNTDCEHHYNKLQSLDSIYMYLERALSQN